MRILVLGLNYAPEPTGVGPYTTRLARLLSEEGHAVHVVTGLPHYPMWKFSQEYAGRGAIEERDGAVRVTRLRHPLPGNTLGVSRIAMEVVFAGRTLGVRTEKPDLIVAVSPALLTVAAALVRRRQWGTPVGVLSQDLYCRALAETGALGGRGARLASWLEKALLRRADGVSVIHDQLKTTLTALGVESEKITVNRNWTHIGAVPASAPEFRRAQGWRDDETVVLHAGNMGAKQGLENVVSAARLAEHEGRHELRFVMLGDGCRRAHLEGLAAGLSNVEFIDPLPDGEFEKALAAADILLLNEKPGLREMCVPGKLTSYFAAARPVVAATALDGAAAGEIAAARAGVCVAAGDPRGLLGAITELQDAPERALSMGAGGLAYSTDVLSEEAATRSYLGWIELLTSGADAVPIPRQRVAGTRRALEPTTTDRRHQLFHRGEPTMTRTILVAGGGGFIGGALVRRLRDSGHEVRAVDKKPLDAWHQIDPGADNRVSDLSDREACLDAVRGVDEVYNLAADMGGMGFIENNKALCMLSVLINTHLLMAVREAGVGRYFFSSSACVYAAGKQTSPDVRPLREGDAYPAAAEDGYGWEKLFSERMCRHFAEDFGIRSRVARYHNVYGPHGTWSGGREKAPAAICRKVAEVALGLSDCIEIWGDGEQTRSFMYIDDCVAGTQMIMDGPPLEPINLGSAELVSINQLVDIVEDVAGVRSQRRYVLDAPQGVRGRSSDNTLIQQRYGWEPATVLKDGLRETYDWVYRQLSEQRVG